MGGIDIDLFFLLTFGTSGVAERFHLGSVIFGFVGRVVKGQVGFTQINLAEWTVVGGWDVLFFE